MEPKVGDRIPGIKYDTLMPEDIEPYLNGRSWEDLKVGDEIAFPDTEPDDTLTPESLVGRRVTVTEGGKDYEGIIESFVSGTGKHEVALDVGLKKSYDFKDEKGAEGVVIGPYDVRGVCIIRELGGEVHARTN